MNTPKDYLESIGIKDRTIRVLTFNEKNFMLTDLMLDYAKLYAESQVKTCDLADVGESCDHDYKPLGCGFDKVCVKCDKKVSIE